MNINNVYIAKIYVKLFDDINIDAEKNIQNTQSYGKFVKNALIYDSLEKEKLPCYIDLESGKKYTKFNVTDAKIGELYIKLDDGLMPLNNLIHSRIKNMSKRRILKKYENRKRK